MNSAVIEHPDLFQASNAYLTLTPGNGVRVFRKFKRLSCTLMSLFFLFHPGSRLMAQERWVNLVIDKLTYEPTLDLSTIYSCLTTSKTTLNSYNLSFSAWDGDWNSGNYQTISGQVGTICTLNGCLPTEIKDILSVNQPYVGWDSPILHFPVFFKFSATNTVSSRSDCDVNASFDIPGTYDDDGSTSEYTVNFTIKESFFKIEGRVRFYWKLDVPYQTIFIVDKTFSGCCEIIPPIAPTQNNVVWYWQTDSMGTSTDYPTTQDYVLCPNLVQPDRPDGWIRARGNTTGEWSAAGPYYGGATPKPYKIRQDTAVSTCYPPGEMVQLSEDVIVKVLPSHRRIVIKNNNDPAWDCTPRWQVSTSGPDGPFSDMAETGTTLIKTFTETSWVRLKNDCAGASCTQPVSNVIQVDVIKIEPQAITKDITVYLQNNSMTSISPWDVNDGSITDDCGIAGMSLDRTTFYCVDAGRSNQVMLTITDYSGRTSTAPAAVTVLDATPPDLVTKDVTVYLGSDGTVHLNPNSLVENLNDCPGLSLSVSPNAFDCSKIGPNSVNLKATDRSGNSTIKTALVTVVDPIPAQLVCPKDKLVSLNSDQCSFVTDGSGYGLTNVIPSVPVEYGYYADNCGVVSVTNDLNDGVNWEFQLGITDVTWTVTDAGGNQTNCTFTVTVIDKQAPALISCPNPTIMEFEADPISCDAIVNYSLPFFKDPCGEEVVITRNGGFDSGTTFPLGETIFTFTGSDLIGNSTNDVCQTLVRVKDVTPPIAHCKNFEYTFPKGATASGSIGINPPDIDDGSFDACGEIRFVRISPNFFTCSDVGENQVTLTVSDLAGNSSTCQSLVVIKDSPPELNCKDITLDVNTGPQIITPTSILVNFYDPSNFTWCQGNNPPNLSLDRNTFSCTDVGKSPVTVTVTSIDYLGGSTTCQSNVQVIDGGISTLSCGFVNVDLKEGENQTVDLNNLYQAADLCGLISVIPAQTNITVDCANYGQTLQIPVTATDVNGNQATCNMRVIVRSPYWANCNQITVELDKNGQAFVPSSEVANYGTPCSQAREEYDQLLIQRLRLAVAPYPDIDIHGGLTFGPEDAGKSFTYLYEITAPSFQKCFANVSVIEYQGPTSVCQDITVVLDDSGQAVITPDQVDGGSTSPVVFTLNLDKTNFQCTDLGANTVTLTAFGNDRFSSCEAVVTVVDDTPPTALCKRDVTAYLDDSGNITVTPEQIDDGSSDNCTIVNRTLDQYDFDCAPLGPRSITLTVEDASGHTASCTGTLTITDSIPPTASCEDITVELGANGKAIVSPVQIGGNTTDNCIEVGIRLSQTLFDCNNLGENTVTLTATDGTNLSTCMATITVQDNQPPNLICRDATVYLDENGSYALFNGLFTESITDNCGVGGGYVSPSQVDCSMAGQVVEVGVYWGDASGNYASCTALVTVADHIKPVAICKTSVIAHLDANGNATVQASDLDNGSTDNCGSTDLIFAYIDGTNKLNFNCNDVNTSSTYPLIVLDASGNASTCFSQIVVKDEIAPVARCQDATIYLQDDGVAQLGVAQIQGGSTDNCLIQSFSADKSAFSCDEAGPNLVTLTIVDQSGNASTCLSTVTVLDNTVPTLVCPDDINVLTDPGECSAQIAAGLTSPVIVSDNCFLSLQYTLTGNPYGLLPTYGAEGNGRIGSLSIPGGSATIEYRVRDVSGNLATCQFTITVNDREPPQLKCPKDITVNTDPDACNAMVSYTVSLSDNCPIFNFAPANLPVQTGGLASGAAFPIGITLNTFQFADVQGNASTCSFTVAVEDHELPTIICPENQSISLNPGYCDLPVYYPDPVVADNCSATWEKTEGPNSGDVFQAGETQITFEATDHSGNARHCSFSVTLISDKQDSDGDGIPNQCDNCPHDVNPDQSDYDHDGVGDLCDKCPGLDDTRDENGNGIPDCLENGSDPCSTGQVVIDSDGDGIDDSCDNCPFEYNPDQLDTDQDGIGDVCDNCVFNYNDNQKDTDNDGIGDACDNCKKNYNPDQADDDGDGVGNACEKEQGGKNLVIDQPFELSEQVHVYPNPFRSTLRIECQIPAEEPVLLQIVNLEGQVIAVIHSGLLPAGQHQWQWNGDNTNGSALSSGIYLLQLKTKESVHNQRIVLQR